MIVQKGGVAQPTGDLRVETIRARPYDLRDLDLVRSLLDPKFADCEEAADWKSDNRARVLEGHKPIALAHKHSLPTFYGALFLTKKTAEGRTIDLGLASLRVITTAGVNFLVDAWQNIVELEIMKYHGIGSDGTTAEAIGNTALGAEFTTQLSPDNTRATGTLEEGATANIFKTVGTNVVDSAVVNREHGLFSQAATGGGVLWDRSIYADVNLGVGDAVATDYRATFTPGG